MLSKGHIKRNMLIRSTSMDPDWFAISLRSVLSAPTAGEVSCWRRFGPSISSRAPHAKLFPFNFPRSVTKSGMVDAILAAVRRGRTIQRLDSRIGLLFGREVYEAIVMGTGLGAHRIGRADNLADGFNGPAFEEGTHLDIESILVADLG